ncbi:hypothetical protein DV738_g1130, partial [Chaetothyriales sp. CBS 135597]
MRPVSGGYPTYIDGIGMTMTGERWAQYCSRCRDHWARENAILIISQLGEQQPSWSFPPPSRAPGSLGPGVPDEANRDSVDTDLQPPQAQPWPPNPFGTREEIASEDWESPLTSMFSRAWSRFREAENARYRLEREMEEQLLPEIAPGSPSSQARALREELRHIQNLARDMASEISQTHSALNSGQLPLSSSPPRVNPIDEQSRPPGLTSREMVEPPISDDGEMEGVLLTGPPVILPFPSPSDLEADPMEVDGEEEFIHCPIDWEPASKSGPDIWELVGESPQAIETEGRHHADYRRFLEYLPLSPFSSFVPPLDEQTHLAIGAQMEHSG